MRLCMICMVPRGPADRASRRPSCLWAKGLELSEQGIGLMAGGIVGFGCFWPENSPFRSRHEYGSFRLRVAVRKMPDRRGGFSWLGLRRTASLDANASEPFQCVARRL